MDEPIITFGSESLILEMFPQLTPAENEPEQIIEQEETILEVIEIEPKKSWCSIS